MTNLNRRLRERNARVERYLTLVEPIAGHYACRCPESRDDLRQVGLLGLIRAAELYRPETGVPFAAFARSHVRGTILHYLRDQAPLLRLPRRRQEFELQRRRAALQLRQQLSREPSGEELRQACGLEEGRWRQLLALPPLPQRVCGTEPDALVAAASDEDPASEERTDVLAALQQLGHRQRQVVRDVVLAGRSLRQVAEAHHTSATTAHRLLHQGLAELRRLLNPPSAAPAC